MIPASIEYVVNTSRSTTIGIDGVYIHTVEHVLAALSAYQIDNLLIEISDMEPPIGDGSSQVFIEMIESAGVVSQEGTVSPFQLSQPVYFSEGSCHLVALPADEFRISYTLHYPEHPRLHAQFVTFPINAEVFKQQIASSRTFSTYEEVSLLMDLGLIKGGSLANAVIIHRDAVFSQGGMRFPDEMARHKLLDLIGDLSLIGFSIRMHVIAIRSGHETNIAFAKKLYGTIMKENFACQT